MLRDALSSVNEGIRVGGHLIKTVRFADDQATLASSVKGLQLMMGKMQESVGEYDMKINVKKTKVKKICKRPGEEFTIFLEGRQLSQESLHFDYLRSLITQDGSLPEEENYKDCHLRYFSEWSRMTDLKERGRAKAGGLWDVTLEKGFKHNLV